MSISETLGNKKEIVLSSGRIRYRETGQGKVLLFVHGILANGDVWRNVVNELSKNFRCITPDWPLGAHKLPMRKDFDFSLRGIASLISELIEALNLENVTLIGNDTGGSICQYVAVNYSESIEMLVLTPCDSFKNFPPKIIRHLKYTGRTPFGLYILGNLLRFPIIYKLPIAFGRLTERSIPPEIMRSYTSPLRKYPSVRREFAKFVRNMDPNQTVMIAEKLKDFKKPTLIIWANERRPFFPLSHGEELHKIIKNSVLVVIEDSGPFVTEDKPKEVVGAIEDFLTASKHDCLSIETV